MQKFNFVQFFAVVEHVNETDLKFTLHFIFHTFPLLFMSIQLAVCLQTGVRSAAVLPRHTVPAFF